MGSRTPVFPLSNGLNPSFMPTQQRPNRALTESLADQFHLIRQLTFQKLVLASISFLFARYFLRLAWEVVPLYWHCLMMVAFDALVHQLLIFNLELLLLGFRQDWLGFLFCVSYRFLFILTIFWL
ncbi:Hypothetical_protein [Hexamita inflata]|uniref:Hypothetical_protein n=1 Tax=Hexamita inflata TaxID=28002 RepID=A0AA86UAC4_9EUKA|nr:Hypothetical protein HINF_LOCUS37365 [Hexamita inflata]